MVWGFSVIVWVLLGSKWKRFWCISQDEEEGALPAYTAALELGQLLMFHAMEETDFSRPLGWSTGRCWEHTSIKPKWGTGRLALEVPLLPTAFHC